MSNEHARERDLVCGVQLDAETSIVPEFSRQVQDVASRGWFILGPERDRRCPKEYQNHVNAIGGMNRYGNPNFKIVWLQGPVDLIYGVDANGKNGQHVIERYGNIPAWGIEIWKPPECFGTPEFWYAVCWDWEVDAPTIGEYPWRGMYFPANFNLYVRHFEGDQMIIDAMPLNHSIIDLIIPNLLKAQEETYAQKKQAILNAKMAEQQKAAKLAFDAYLDAAPAFGGKAGTFESNRERWMSRIAEKQAGMKISAEEIKRRMGSGHRQC